MVNNEREYQTHARSDAIRRGLLGRIERQVCSSSKQSRRLLLDRWPSTPRALFPASPAIRNQCNPDGRHHAGIADHLFGHYTRLVFQVNENGNWDIYSVNVDGSNLTRMTDHPRGDSSGVFSPDGTRILFASDRGGINELFVMPAEGGEPVQITRNKGVWYRTVWAPDGPHILYRASVPPAEDMSQPGEFYRVRPDGREEGVLPGGKRREVNQSYSPDGRMIAFDAHGDGVTWESGRQWDIWLMNADGSGRRNLTARNNVNDWGPSWSPDGKTIVFLSDTNNIYDLHLMNVEGTNVRRFPNWAVLPAKLTAAK